MANTQASGLDDRRPHAGEAESFFRALEESGHLPPGVGAPDAGMAALALLSLSLRGSMARRFVAALPETLRALVGPVLDGRDPAPVVSGRDQYLGILAEHLGLSREEALRLARAVFAALQHELPPRRDIAEVAAGLPEDLRAIWERID